MHLFVKVSISFKYFSFLLIWSFICLVSGDGSDQYMLGTQNSVSWIPPPGPGSTPTLKYSYQNPTTGDLKQVTMNLFCVGEGEDSFEFVLESPVNNYNFNWKNKCLCWNGCLGKSLWHETIIYLCCSVDLYILSNHYYRTTAHYYCITLSYRRWNTIAWNSYNYHKTTL